VLDRPKTESKVLDDIRCICSPPQKFSRVYVGICNVSSNLKLL
jgi:hypothetical protein